MLLWFYLSYFARIHNHVIKKNTEINVIFFYIIFLFFLSFDFCEIHQ